MTSRKPFHQHFRTSDLLFASPESLRSIASAIYLFLVYKQSDRAPALVTETDVF
jgi:hypothetical protein